MDCKSFRTIVEYSYCETHVFIGSFKKVSVISYEEDIINCD